MVVPVPPSVVHIPAALPLGVQISPALLSLVAAFAMLANRLVQFRLRALNLALALSMVIRIRLGNGHPHGRAQSRRHNRCCCNSFKAL
jgi:hypothetical protein